MHLAFTSALVFALVAVTTSSVLPIHEINFPRTSQLLDPPHDLNDDITSSPHSLPKRMDVWKNPGDRLPGRVGFTFSLVHFISFVGSIVDTRSAASTALLAFYSSAMQQFLHFPDGTAFEKPIFLRGELMTLWIDQKSGTEPLTSDTVQSFLAHMIAKLAYGGYVGAYEAYLRQERGSGCFFVRLHSNTFWLAEGVPGLPGMIGLAGLGFKV